MLQNIHKIHMILFNTALIFIPTFPHTSIAILTQQTSDQSFSSSNLNPQVIPYRNSSISRSSKSIKNTIALIGEPCDPSDEPEIICPAHSTCTEITLTSTRKHVCSCNEMYTANLENSQCIRVQGSPCNHSPNECDTRSTFLFCINSVCKCEESDYYNPNTKKCEGRVGGLCFNGVKECVSNAKCIHRYHNHHLKNNFHYKDTTNSRSSNSFNSGKKVARRATSSNNYATVNSNSDIEETGKCECDQGYVESAHGFCKKGYGMSCSSRIERDYHYAFECDELNFVCKDGICDCPDSLQIYQKESQSCVALAGAKCNENNVMGIACVEGAECKRLNLKLDGRCQCRGDWVEMPDRTCGRVSIWRPVY